MPRPRLRRRIGWRCNFTHVAPIGPGIVNIEETILAHDELEAIRLKDFKGLEQEKAAKEMNISQPTFHRLILSARKKIADALINNKIIKVEGGNYEMVSPVVPRRGLRRGIGRGGRGRMRGRRGGVGPGGYCICPECGYRQKKTLGVPCTELKCKKCNAMMVRE
jgi:predicted DNA-binding protein (UPF0251 family)